MKEEKFPWLSLIQKYIKNWRDSWNESEESEELNNSGSSKPSIMDEANDFCAIEEFDGSSKSSEQGNLLKGIDNRTVRSKGFCSFFVSLVVQF